MNNAETPRRLDLLDTTTETGGCGCGSTDTSTVTVTGEAPLDQAHVAAALDQAGDYQLA